VQAFIKPEENCRLLRVEKRQCSPVYNNEQPHLHNPPHPERSKREREREREVGACTQTPAGCVISDSFIKSEGLNCCVFTISFAIWTSAELWECDVNWPQCTHRTSKTVSRPTRPLGFTVKWLAPHIRILLHKSEVQLQGSIHTLDKLHCPRNEIFGAGN